MNCPDCGSKCVSILHSGFVCLECGFSRPRIPMEAILTLKLLFEAADEAEAINRQHENHPTDESEEQP